MSLGTAAYEEKLKEILKWLGNPNLIVVHNVKSVELTSFEKESKIVE